MNKYTIYCTEEQTKKALELGAPLIKYDCYKHRFVNPCVIGKACYITPTAEQMIGWLKTKGLIFLLSDGPCSEGCCWFISNGEECVVCGEENENKELAAIDAALEYLINNK